MIRWRARGRVLKVRGTGKAMEAGSPMSIMEWEQRA